LKSFSFDCIIVLTLTHRDYTMNTNETMMEQIRRLNREEARKHELRKQEALNKIRQRRALQKQKELSV